VGLASGRRLVMDNCTCCGVEVTPSHDAHEVRGLVFCSDGCFLECDHDGILPVDRDIEKTTPEEMEG